MRSDSQPLASLSNDAVDSATPSIAPSAVALAPRTVVRKIGSSGKDISLATSVSKLTPPSVNTLRPSRGGFVSANALATPAMAGIIPQIPERVEPKHEGRRYRRPSSHHPQASSTPGRPLPYPVFCGVVGLRPPPRRG